MEDNKTLILREFESMKGQFVLTQSHNVERLVSIGSDDTDYYWITYNGRKMSWSTCVGKVIQLKGYLKDEDYNEFIRLAKINHFDQPTLWCHKPEEIISFKELNSEGITYQEFADNHKKEMETLTAPDEFLTPVCWELN